MNDYSKIISNIEIAVKGIKDESLRKIAFETLLQHELNIDTQSQSHSILKTFTNPKGIPVIKKIKKKSAFSGPYNSKTIREEIISGFRDLTANQSGLKPFSSLKQKYEKFIWTLEAGRKKGITAMTNDEIAYVLSDKLAQSVTSKQVNNLKQKLKFGLIQAWKIDGKKAWKIVQDGINLVSTEKI